MDLAGLKEKLLRALPRAASPLELLKKLKEALLSLGAKVFSLAKGLPGRFSGSSGEAREDEASPLAGKRKVIIFGLGGVAVVLGILIIVISVNHAGPEKADSANIASGLSIPVEELFYPVEPDFLPGFLPEREPKRFWTLDDIRLYWRAPGNSDWWMEGIKTTVDSLMEGVP